MLRSVTCPETDSMLSFGNDIDLTLGGLMPWLNFEANFAPFSFGDH